jgi:hypothetical protein
MKRRVLWQRIEGAGVFAAAIAIHLHIGAGLPWWAAVLIFLAPDVSFAAYAAGPRIGAWIYNALHLYALGLVVLAAGLLAAQPVTAAVGALWIAHAGFDRMLGYGLKSESGFQETHLGRIGRAA